MSDDATNVVKSAWQSIFIALLAYLSPQNLVKSAWQSRFIALLKSCVVFFLQFFWFLFSGLVLGLSLNCEGSEFKKVYI